MSARGPLALLPHLAAGDAEMEAMLLPKSAWRRARANEPQQLDPRICVDLGYEAVSHAHRDLQVIIRTMRHVKLPADEPCAAHLDRVVMLIRSAEEHLSQALSGIWREWLAKTPEPFAPVAPVASIEEPGA